MLAQVEGITSGSYGSGWSGYRLLFPCVGVVSMIFLCSNILSIMSSSSDGAWWPDDSKSSDPEFIFVLVALEFHELFDVFVDHALLPLLDQLLDHDVLDQLFQLLLSFHPGNSCQHNWSSIHTNHASHLSCLPRQSSHKQLSPHTDSHIPSWSQIGSGQSLGVLIQAWRDSHRTYHLVHWIVHS